ncbi:MAG: MtnX-like HAD-IB family phosphatase [Ignavibacteriae bacterium]|nr:MtnX-like HAD-IB family phosphatase [Ignavibacteriota bacterium]
MALKIFVDFDGTITQQDVGNLFFRTFGGASCDEAVGAYRAEKISAKELFRRETDAIGELDEVAAGEFLRGQKIDDGFMRFVEFCRKRGIEFHVVSDGLDYYIREILSNNGCGDVSFFANKLERTPTSNGSSKLSITFPHDDAECSRCACCKRNIMLARWGEDDILVYVGEGYSDRCPAQYADIVFAKDELQTYCQAMNISYHLYTTFDDVISRLEEILSKKRIKPRREAEMKRREAFVAEY